VSGNGARQNKKTGSLALTHFVTVGGNRGTAEQILKTAFDF